MKFQYIIFDMDGLLVDSEQLAFRVMADILKEKGYEMSQDVANSLLGTSVEETDQLLREAYPDANLSTEAITPDYLHYIEQGALSLMPGAANLLDYLEEQCIHKCIASSNLGYIVDQTLNSVGIADRFDFILHGDMVEFAKPEPDLFLESARRWGVQPKECLVLEDSFAGIYAANTAGSPVIMVPDIAQPTPEIREKCLAVCDSLDDVIVFLQS